MNLEQSLKDNFARYAGMTIQQRALIDVRDALKPSARMCMYAQFLEKLTHDKPIKKSAVSVAKGMEHFYTHGDSSLYKLLMRMGKPFAYRYPLEEVQGSYGTLIESGDEAASRYTEMRLNKTASYLFKNIEKNVIDTWFDNYDDTKKYPSVLPSLGFYNIVNGTSGISTALASSIPQFNLREVNEALIKLLWNPNVDFEEIYCAPDFATGAILINEKEVKESLKIGTGKACILRSSVTYDNKDNCLIITEIPYGVYTNTICKQLSALVNSEVSYGISKILDLTKKTPCIKIYLTKNANPHQVIKTLYKKTSLQYHFGINMTMLQDGKFPRVFGWKEALLEHNKHSKTVLKKSLIFDIEKAKIRLHIVDGLLLAIDNIIKVIEIIKQSSSTQNAKTKLMENFAFSIEQSNAILEMKLSRLANLEKQKYINEKTKLEELIQDKQEILDNKEKFLKEIEKNLLEVAKMFGDARRTTITNLKTTEDDEPIEEKKLFISLTNFGNIYVTESNTLISQRRGGVGKKNKLLSNEFIINSIIDDNTGNLLFFSNAGKVFSIKSNDLKINDKTHITELFQINDNEKITNIISFNNKNNYKYIAFITKNGIIKKSLLSLYLTKNNKINEKQALKINDGDSICDICLLNNENIVLSTKLGKINIIETTDIKDIGRLCVGVKAISLSDDDELVSAKIVNNNSKFIITITQDNFIKKTNIKDISNRKRGAMGSVVHKISKDTTISGAIVLEQDSEILIYSKLSQILINTKDIETTSKRTLGVKVFKDITDILGITKNI